MTEWIITSSMLITVIIVLRFIFKEKISRKLQYALWGLVLLRLLMPFQLIGSPFSVMNWVKAAESSVVTYLSTDLSEKAELTPNELRPNAEEAGQGTAQAKYETAQTQTNKSMPPTVSDVFSSIWLIGSIALGVWFIVTNLIFYKKLRKTRKACDIDCELQVYITEAIASPCLFGIPKPVIYLTPKAIENENCIHHILLHELCHYHQGDYIWTILRGVCLSVWWWNPLVWIAAILSRTDSEFACDEAVIKRIGEEDRLAYGHTLINMIAVKTAPSGIMHTPTTMISGKNDVKKRLNRIIKKPKTYIPAMVAAVLIAVLCACSTFTSAKNTRLTAQEALEQLTSSIKHSNKQVIFVIPKSYENPKGWNIHVAGRQKFEDGFSKSVHLFEDVNDAKAWESGKQYAIDINDSYTELTLTAFLPGENGKTLEKNVNLLLTEGNTSGNFGTTNATSRTSINSGIVTAGINVPDVVLSKAKELVSQWFQDDQVSLPKNNYIKWKVESLKYSYTYSNFDGMTLQVYRMNYEYLSKTPENVALVGGMYATEDGWIMPNYPNCHYLIFRQNGDTLTFLTAMMENDCTPGDTTFTDDLRNKSIH